MDPLFRDGIYPDGRLVAPATARNRDPILDVLRTALPARGHVLEIASGTGEHVAHFAAALTDLTWQPSDPDAGHRKSTDAWARRAGLANVSPALHVDVRAESWPVDQADAILCINMIHIAPWEATIGLFRGAAALLASGQALILYGPYMFDGQHTAPSNERFDHSLRSRDPSWGVRDLSRVEQVASVHAFDLIDQVPMPANNWTVVFQKR